MTTERIEYIYDANTAGMEGGLNRVNSGTSRLKAGWIAVAGASAGVVAGLTKSVSIASDLNEGINVAQATLGKEADGVVAWSKTLTTSFGLSQKAAIETVTSFSGLTRAMGFTDKQGAQMSKQLTMMSADLSSFYNTSQSEAANALKGIFTGEYDSLKNYGIMINDTTLKQNGYNSSMTQSQKSMIALKIATDTYSKTAKGDFAKTQTSVANLTRSIGADLTGVATNIGTALLPVVQAVLISIEHITKALSMMKFPKIQGTSNFNSSILDNMFSLVTTLAQVIQTTLVQAVSVLTFTLKALSPALLLIWNGFTKLMAILTPLCTQLISILNPALELVGNVLKLIISILAPLVNGLVSILVPVLTTIASIISAVLYPILVIIGTVIQQLSFFIENITVTLSNLGAYLLTGLGPILQALHTFVSTMMIPTLVSIGNYIVTMLGPTLQALGNLLVALYTNILAPLFNFIETVVITTINILVNIIQAYLNVVLNVLSNIVSKLANVFKTLLNIIKNVATFISSTFVGAFKLASSVVNGLLSPVRALANAFSSLFGVMGKVGGFLGGKIGSLFGVKATLTSNPNQSPTQNIQHNNQKSIQNNVTIKPQKTMSIKEAYRQANLSKRGLV